MPKKKKKAGLSVLDYGNNSGHFCSPTSRAGSGATSLRGSLWPWRGSRSLTSGWHDVQGTQQASVGQHEMALAKQARL